MVDKVRLIMESTYTTNKTVLGISEYLYENGLDVVDFHEQIQDCINELVTLKALELEGFGTMYYENGMTYFLIDSSFFKNHKNLTVKGLELISSSYVLLLMFNYCYRSQEELPISVYNTLGKISLNCDISSLNSDLNLVVACNGMKVLNDNIEVL